MVVKVTGGARPRTQGAMHPNKIKVAKERARRYEQLSSQREGYVTRISPNPNQDMMVIKGTHRAETVMELPEKNPLFVDGKAFIGSQ